MFFKYAVVPPSYSDESFPFYHPELISVFHAFVQIDSLETQQVHTCNLRREMWDSADSSRCHDCTVSMLPTPMHARRTCLKANLYFTMQSPCVAVTPLHRAFVLPNLHLKNVLSTRQNDADHRQQRSAWWILVLQPMFCLWRCLDVHGVLFMIQHFNAFIQLKSTMTFGNYC